jgi:hypothetical protein
MCESESPERGRYPELAAPSSHMRCPYSQINDWPRFLAMGGHPRKGHYTVRSAARRAMAVRSSGTPAPVRAEVTASSGKAAG